MGSEQTDEEQLEIPVGRTPCYGIGIDLTVEYPTERS